ncbi:MAG: hypothetical protein ABIJ15_04855 [bacterium]
MEPGKKYISVWNLISVLSITLVWLILTGGVLSFVVMQIAPAFGDSESPPGALASMLFAFAFVFALLYFGWYTIVAMPYKIKYISGKSIVLGGLIRKILINPADIKSIAVSKMPFGTVNINSSKKIHILHNTKIFKDLIKYIKDNNSSVQIRSYWLSPPRKI